jgi:hypothetical protein
VGREEHGTAENHPKDSPLTHDFYSNIDSAEIFAYLPVDDFRAWALSYLETDIRFYGFKQNS